MSRSALELQLKGYCITTAEILYRIPDHLSLLQTFVWQNYDVYPKFPELRAFLDFWETNLEGPLFKVRVVHHSLISPREIRMLSGDFRLN